MNNESNNESVDLKDEYDAIYDVLDKLEEFIKTVAKVKAKEKIEFLFNKINNQPNWLVILIYKIF